MTGPVQVVAEGSAEHGDPSPGAGFQRTVWGWLKRAGVPLGVHCARFTIGRREAGADLLVSLGGWGPGEDEAARRSFGFRVVPGPGARPTFSPADAAAVAWSAKVPLGRLLAAAEHAADPEADLALRLAQQVAADDERVRGFLARGGRDPRRATELVERAYQRVNDSDDVAAEVDATQALGFDPEAWDAYFMRGWARARAEQWDGAVDDLERYLARSPRGRHAARAAKVLALARRRRDGPLGAEGPAATQ